MKKVILANAFSINMLPENMDVINLNFKKISKEEVTNILKNGFESSIGHKDLANLLGDMFNIEIPVNRSNVKLDKNIQLVVAQYIGPRLPEGTTKLPEGSKIEFFVVELI